jgi:hypothetical protein
MKRLSPDTLMGHPPIQNGRFHERVIKLTSRKIEWFSEPFETASPILDRKDNSQGKSSSGYANTA